MKVIFFGTPDYVIPVVELLFKNYELVAVVTNPARPFGREKKMTYSPIDNWAHKRHIPVITSFDEELPGADLGILAAYGSFVPNSVINHFKYGIINIHPSLLPSFRGASPIQGALAQGLSETGISIMKLSNKMDAGEILSQLNEPILPDDTNETLRVRLFSKTGPVLLELIPSYVAGKINLKIQDETKVTLTRQIKKEDGLIAFEVFKDLVNGSGATHQLSLDFIKPSPILTLTSKSFTYLLHALSPWPLLYTLLPNGQRLKIISVKSNVEDSRLVPDMVQLEGKNAVSWEQFRQGHPEVKFG